MPRRRVGVIFGGRSGEHEVSLASAASVIAALERRGHEIVPIGIARDGRWVVGGDPMRELAARARGAAGADAALGDVATAAVKTSLAERAETMVGPSQALARMEPAGGLPAELRQPLDVVLIMLHGPYGEDGTIQGLLELADVPYVGAGVLASAVGMDKATMKAVFRAHGLPIVEYTIVLRRQWRANPEAVRQRIVDVTGFPCFVKPSNLGSSVGIHKVKADADLVAAMDDAARYDRKIVVERAVTAREVEVSVLGNDVPEASMPGEITYAAEWYDYATKYAEGRARLIVPASLPAAVTTRVRELAVAAFRAIDCAGMARVDFFIEGDRVLVNEINTIPGFTSTSAYARLWEASGLPYDELIERLMALAIERHRELHGPGA